MAVSVFEHHIHLCGGFVTTYLVTSVPVHHITYVVVLDCIPAADVGVPPVCPCCPLLHHGDGAGVNAGEVSNTKAQLFHHGCGRA